MGKRSLDVGFFGNGRYEILGPFRQLGHVRSNLEQRPDWDAVEPTWVKRTTAVQSVGGEFYLCTEPEHDARLLGQLGCDGVSYDIYSRPESHDWPEHGVWVCHLLGPGFVVVVDTQKKRGGA